MNKSERIIIAQIQTLIGMAQAANLKDSENRMEDIHVPLARAFELCLQIMPLGHEEGVVSNMKLYAVFLDGTRKEIDLNSAGIRENASQAEALVLAKKELTHLEERNLSRWEFEEKFI